MRVLRTLFLALALLPSPLSLFSQNTDVNGQIQGTVVSPDGQPLSRASVTVQRQRSPGATPFRATVFTEPDGSFVVSDAPSGAYRICIQAPGTAFLNPCIWSGNPPSATVQAGQTAPLGELPLEAGYLVRVRLNDANGLLQDDEASVRAARVQVGIWTPNGLFIPMRIRTRSATSRVLELPVPFGAAVELSARSGFYALSNEDNAGIDANQGARIPIQAAPDTPSRLHTFHVTGRRPAP